ncbi:acyltransferase family protein [Niabella ginsengisoli]|uniref:Acyltransferase n=1 Tax=Niabella ginsengisoli TaxID=522298 RepID=A0ABS9SQW8_9BACT|nr:acyltransferase [Niabella ginsengisoli]MCH5600766.1 acyltransferase [Niabella ginsengisoli]
MQNNLKSAKPHYAALDGLRGIAAIAVVIFHCYEILTPDLTKNPIAHGYLAVDFFFCLSGFVVAYAYDKRIKTLGVKQFLINRLIRLQPLVVLGTVLGLLGFLFDPFLTASPVREFGWGKIILATVCSLLLLPSPILGRYENVFPLNAPAWSLSMEYFINLFYAFVLIHLSKKMLLLFLVLATAFIITVAYLHGSIVGGWSASSYGDGYARVLFSFLAGLTVYRFNLILKNRINFLLYGLLLSGVFLFPHFENDWFTEIAFVILLFPLIISGGAGTQVSERLRKICIFLGDISYPLYMVHYWMIWILGNYAATNPGQQKLYIFSIGILISSILLAWISLKYFDEPVRKWLKMKMKSNKS